MTIDEVADYLSVKKGTIYGWTHMEFIPHIKLGKSLRFRESDIDAWIEKRFVKGRSRRRIDIDALLESHPGRPKKQSAR